MAFVLDTSYGVVGDGIADDTSAMQSAASNGNMVVCQFSHYYLSANITGNFFFTGPVTFTGPGILYNEGFQQPKSHKFFASSGATVNRFNDRVFIGGATDADGNYPQVANDWLSTFYIANGYPTGYTAVGQLMVENSDHPAAGEAIVGAAHSLHFTSPDTSPIGVTAVGVNDNTTLATSAWGIYAEGHHVSPTAASTFACELGIRSTIAAGAANPYFLGATGALQIEAGCGVTAEGQHDATVYIQMANGTTRAQTGINFMADSLTGCDGVTGTAVAIAMAKGHLLQWYASNGIPTGNIRCQGTTASNSVQVHITDGLFEIQSASNGGLQHAFNVNDSNVNYLNFYGSTAGSAVAIAAGGTDANIDLKLAPKGSGCVWLGAYTAGSTAASGYILVKDSNGNTRKLLCA